MFTAAEMAEHQADAEADMLDTFAAFAPGPPGRNADGYSIDTWLPRGTTAGKTQGPSRGRDTEARTVRVGGADLTVIQGGLHLPVSAFLGDTGLLLEPGWQLQCTRIGPATDPAQLGRRWHVVEVPTKARLSARRLDVVEVAARDLD